MPEKKQTCMYCWGDFGFPVAFELTGYNREKGEVYKELLCWKCAANNVSNMLYNPEYGYALIRLQSLAWTQELEPTWKEHNNVGGMESKN